MEGPAAVRHGKDYDSQYFDMEAYLAAMWSETALSDQFTCTILDGIHEVFATGECVSLGKDHRDFCHIVFITVAISVLHVLIC